MQPEADPAVVISATWSRPSHGHKCNLKQTQPWRLVQPGADLAMVISATQSKPGCGEGRAGLGQSWMRAELQGWPAILGRAPGPHENLNISQVSGLGR